MLVCILILCFTHLIDVQSLNAFLEDGSIESIDEEFFDAESVIEIVAQNETFNTLFTDIIIVKVIPEDTMGYLAIWLKSMGEYNVPTGLAIAMKVCDMGDDPFLMGPLLETIGFSKDKCPPPPGRYGSPSYFPNLDMMPDSMPGSQYMISFVMKNGDRDLLNVRLYVEVF